MKRTLVLLAMSLVLGGCMTATVQSRRQERMAAYQALSPEFREAVDHGELKSTMSEDAVYIAWGKPSRILQGGNATGETTTWVYIGTSYQEVIWTGWRVHYAYATVPYTRAHVTFVNGKVTEWQTFAPPSGSY